MPERAGPVAGIVLAAGTSSRMGRNKLFLALDGESVLRRAVRQATAAGLDPVVVVLGYEAERARQALADVACRTVVNPDFERGINSSLSAGMSALPAEARATVVMLADMPFVTAAMIATLVTHYREGTAPLVISDYEGVSAPPMLYDRSLFSELRAMDGEGCGRRVVRNHGAEAAVARWPASALADLDEPADYERATALLEEG